MGQPPDNPDCPLFEKKISGKSKIVQLMYPGNCGIKELDLIIASQHDAAKCKNGNIFLITGCPHRITPKSWSLQPKNGKRPLPACRHPAQPSLSGRHQGQAVQRRKRPQSGTGC
ncbi:MAG: ELM1/GtrOC1 family putative glycosyltransferase [Alphaproteobacteria bacterium]